ncbi:hypothetical protein [Alkalimarinus alittae]|nr:hypothetical protein [Alkalimarinus alittae]
MIMARRYSVGKWLDKYWVAISPVLVAIPLIAVAVISLPAANI